jgi:hypothetical protein
MGWLRREVMVNDDGEQRAAQGEEASALAACYVGDWSKAKHYRYGAPPGGRELEPNEEACANCGKVVRVRDPKTEGEGLSFQANLRDAANPSGPPIWGICFGATSGGSGQRVPWRKLCSLECVDQWVDKMDEWLNRPPSGRHRWIVRL